jgi:hypothetical protein
MRVCFSWAFDTPLERKATVDPRLIAVFLRGFASARIHFASASISESTLGRWFSIATETVLCDAALTGYTCVAIKNMINCAGALEPPASARWTALKLQSYLSNLPALVAYKSVKRAAAQTSIVFSAITGPAYIRNAMQRTCTADSPAPGVSTLHYIPLICTASAAL